VEWYWQGKTGVPVDKPVPVPLCPPTILIWNDVWSNPVFCGDRPANKRLCHDHQVKRQPYSIAWKYSSVGVENCSLGWWFCPVPIRTGTIFRWPWCSASRPRDSSSKCCDVMQTVREDYEKRNYICRFGWNNYLLVCGWVCDTEKHLNDK